MHQSAYAKLNIMLEINGIRADGFHELDMIFLEIGIRDEIRVEKSEEGIHLSCSDRSLPTDERNLAYRAAAILKDRYGIEEGIDIHIDKMIPAQAGLGGGSSDAACVLNCVNKLFELGIGFEQLEEIAAELGSDVAFFIKGGCQRARGKGEILTDAGCFPDCQIVVIKPDVSVSTPWAYRAYDQEHITTEEELVNSITYATEQIMTAGVPENHQTNIQNQSRPAGKAGNHQTSASPRLTPVDNALEAIHRGDYPALCAAMINDLEAPVIKEYPVIRKIKEELLACGADAAMMTGSGSAVFGLFSEKEKAAAAAAAFETDPGYTVFCTEKQRC